MPVQNRDMGWALVELRERVQPDTEPTLSEPELMECLERAERGTVHAVSTAYAYGARVFPATDNGRWYECTTGGTTAGTAPDWPTGDWSTVEDGTVVWACCGLAPRNLWHMRLAEYYAWSKKAAKASEKVNASTGKMKADCAAVFDHCLQMAGAARPTEIG